MGQSFSALDYENDLIVEEAKRNRRRRKIQTAVTGGMTFVVCAIMFAVTFSHHDSFSFLAGVVGFAGMLIIQFTLPKLIADILLPD